MPPPHPSTIYMEEMQSMREGAALWFPEPHSTGEVQIGDVGYVDDGAFIRLFNAISPESYPVLDSEGSELPDGFEPLKPPLTRIGDHRPGALKPGSYPSNSVRKRSMEAAATVGDLATAALEYTCTRERGALLVLGNFATKEVNLAQKHFERYATKHYKSWHKFATERVGIDNPQLILVRGFVKTTSEWAASAYASSRRAAKGSIGAGASTGKLRATVASQHFVQGPAVTRVGRSLANVPDDGRARSARPSRDRRRAVHDDEGHVINDPLTEDNEHEVAAVNERFDQSLFIRGCYVKLRYITSILNWFKMWASAGPDKRYEKRNRSPEQGNPAVPAELSTAGAAENSGTPSESSHPNWAMSILLDYILEHSDANIAACCEEDIEYRLLGQNWPDDIARWLTEQTPSVEIDDDGVGTLSLSEALGMRREYYFKNGIASDSDYSDSTQRRRQRPISTSRQEGSLPTGVLTTAALVLGSRPGMAINWAHLVLSNNDKASSRMGMQMAIASDGKCIATTWDSDPSILLWDVQKARTVFQLRGHADIVQTMVFSPDNTRLASCDQNARVKVWDVTNIAAPHELHTLQAAERVCCSAFSPNGKMLATGSVDGSAMIWDIERGSLLHSLEKHPAPVARIMFSPDGRTLVSCATKYWYSWNVETGEKKLRLVGGSGNILCMQFSHYGDRIIISGDHRPRVWDTHTGNELVAIRDVHTGPVTLASFSPDDSKVITMSHDGTFAICDSLRIKHYHVFHCWQSDDLHDVIWTTAYSSSGGLLATVSSDNVVRLWDTTVGHLVTEFYGHEKKVTELSFTEDGSKVISSDGTCVRVFNVHDVLKLY